MQTNDVLCDRTSKKKQKNNCKIKFSDSVMKIYDPHSCKPAHKMLLQKNIVKTVFDILQHLIHFFWKIILTSTLLNLKENCI